MNKKLGGTEEKSPTNYEILFWFSFLASSKRGTEFDNLKYVIQEKLHEIKAK